MQRTAGTTVAAPDLRRNGMNYRQKDALWGYGLITIPLIGMLIFVLIPFGMSVYASFTSWPMGQAIEKAKVVGLKNYVDMFNNKLFWQSLGNTFYYMIGIPIGLAISLLLAYAMNRGTHYEKVFRVVYYVPVISSVVAITFVFQQIFNSDVGIINEGLRALGVSDPPNWMSHAGYTKWVIMIMAIWKGLGSSIILYIAGMQVDGANWWQTFRKITLPLLMPVTFYLIVTGVIGGSQMYVEPRLMFSGNGPNNSTFTTVIHLYDRTFVNSKAGYGSAVAVFLAVIVFILTLIQFKLNGKGDK